MASAKSDADNCLKYDVFTTPGKSTAAYVIAEANKMMAQKACADYHTANAIAGIEKDTGHKPVADQIIKNILAMAEKVTVHKAFVENVLAHGHNMPVAEMRVLFDEWQRDMHTKTVLNIVFDQVGSTPRKDVFRPIWYRFSAEQKQYIDPEQDLGLLLL